MPRLRQLRQFIAVAEERNFRRAAARLHMSQPPLSQAVQQLEAELGVPLFERNRTGVTPTRAGQAFLEEARHVVAQLERAVAVARGAAHGLSGRLSVGFPNSVTFSVLPEALRRFHAKHGAVDLILEELSTAEQVEALSDGRIDIGLLRPPLLGGRKLVFETILREPLVAVVPEDHALSSWQSVSLHDLRNDPLIVGEPRWSTGFHARIMSACEKAGFVPRVVQVAVQIQTLVTLVAAGLGVTLVPASLGNHPGKGVAYVKLQGNLSDLYSDLGMAWREGNDSAPLDAFREIVRGVAKEMSHSRAG